MGLGGYPDVTLAQAREQARQARNLVSEGKDPILLREQAQSALLAERAKALTFEEAARRFIEAKAPEWTNGKHSAQWTSTLEAYAFPEFGKVLVRDVGQDHVLRALEAIWITKTETASRVRGRIEAVLDWARARGLRDGENPARWRGHLDKLLPKPGKVAKVQHHPAMLATEVPSFYEQLRHKQGQSAAALRLLILTAVRSGELRGATWAEFDLDARVWTIPASRMKAKKTHRVPLSDAAVALLREQTKLEGCNLVFPGKQGRPLSDMALTAVMRAFELDAVPHGFRSTFRDWVSDHTTFPGELAEQALAHAISSKVEAAYRRGEQLEKRRELMQAWSDVVTGQQRTRRGALRRVA